MLLSMIIITIASFVFAHSFDTESRLLLRHRVSSVSKASSPIVPPKFQGSNGAELQRERVSSQQHNPVSLTTAQVSSTAESLKHSRRDSPPPNISLNTEASEIHGVECFNPYSITLKPAAVEDCRIIIDEIILRYPNPFTPQVFGYIRAVDIDLNLDENKKWFYGRCVIFVKNLDERLVDRFRMVDVATNAHKVIQQCVIGKKYPVGGTAEIGLHGFYVAVGGLTPLESENDTTLHLPS